MKTVVLLIALVLAAFACVGQTKSTAPNDNPYPNELSTLKLYRNAKWKSLRPYVSTQEQVHKILGEPSPFYDELLQTDVAGYDGGFDWTIVVSIVGIGGELPNSVVDRLGYLTLYPKRRVSLIGADFSAFSTNSIDNSRARTTIYSDKFGLRYVVYAEDAADGRFHIGDLKLIEYGASDAETERLTRKPDGDAEQSLAADGAIAYLSSKCVHSARMLIARRS
jgi:hypothetical protein